MREGIGVCSVPQTSTAGLPLDRRPLPEDEPRAWARGGDPHHALGGWRGVGRARECAHVVHSELWVLSARAAERPSFPGETGWRCRGRNSRAEPGSDPFPKCGDRLSSWRSLVN